MRGRGRWGTGVHPPPTSKPRLRLSLTPQDGLSFPCNRDTKHDEPQPHGMEMDMNPSAPDDWFIYTVIILVFLAIVVALGSLARRLGAVQTHWSLADALSEETELSVLDATGTPLIVNGAVVKKVQLTASSSRVIAIMGMIGILALFLGFGAFALWWFAKTGTMPSGAADVTKYLVGGVTLFAPYIINKFSSVFAPR
jgi:hypothetical protein